jgi:hypothetical protein
MGGEGRGMDGNGWGGGGGWMEMSQEGRGWKGLGGEGRGGEEAEQLWVGRVGEMRG